MKVRIFIVVLLCFVSLEAILRLTGVVSTYSENNFNHYVNLFTQHHSKFFETVSEKNSLYDKSQIEFSHQYWLDSLGFLGISGKNNCKPTKTVLFLGDSFVFGVGAEKEGNMVSQLQEMFDSICFYNAGIPGSDPFYQEHLFQNTFKKNQFKNVVLALNASDLMDYVFRGGTERFSKDKNASPQEPWFHPLYQYSHLVRAFVHGVLRRDYSLLSQKELIARKEKAVKAYFQLLAKLNTEIKEKFNGNVLVITHPYPTNFQPKKSSLEKEVFNYSYLEDLCEQLNENGVLCADLYSDFAEVLTEENYLAYSWPIDGHFNAKGYKLYADILWNSPKFKEFLKVVKNKKER